MANSTFTVGGTVCTFQAVSVGASQGAGDVERFRVVMLLASQQEWLDAVALTTTKYHIHAPLGGNIVLDVARGLGVGVLVISGLGSTSAILTELERTRYLPGAKSMATATFLLTAVWT